MGQQAAALQSPLAIDVVEMDELHTYIGNKKLLLGVDCSRSLWTPVY